MSAREDDVLRVAVVVWHPPGDLRTVSGWSVYSLPLDRYHPLGHTPEIIFSVKVKVRGGDRAAAINAACAEALAIFSKDPDYSQVRTRICEMEERRSKKGKAQDLLPTEIVNDREYTEIVNEANARVHGLSPAAKGTLFSDLGAERKQGASGDGVVVAADIIGSEVP